MNSELAILRALLRLSRRRQAANLEALLVRVGGTVAEVQAALQNLEASGFVYRSRHGDPQLTLAGLAVAVAQVALVAPRRSSVRRLPAKRRAA